MTLVMVVLVPGDSRAFVWPADRAVEILFGMMAAIVAAGAISLRLRRRDLASAAWVRDEAGGVV